MKSLQSGRSASRISNSRLNYFGPLKTNEGHFKRTLAKILIERVPDSPGSKKVRDFISNEMSSLGWNVELDPFEQDTVIGKVKFTNIIATLNPVCTYDKYIKRGCALSFQFCNFEQYNYFLMIFAFLESTRL